MHYILNLILKAKISIFFILTLLLFFIGYITCIKPAKYKLHCLQRQQIELNKQVETQNKQLNDVLRDQIKFDKLGINYKQGQQQLNKTVNIDFFISKLIHIAALNHISFNLIKPLSPLHKNLVTIYPLQIIICGSYQKLMRFTKNLRDLPYLAGLQNFKIIKTENNNILRMNALMEVYSAKL